MQLQVKPSMQKLTFFGEFSIFDVQKRPLQTKKMIYWVIYTKDFLFIAIKELQDFLKTFTDILDTF